MKIVFDCRYTRIGQHDGISRYTVGVLTELAARHPVTMLISDRRQLEVLPELPWIMGCEPTSLREPWVSLTVNKAKPDVVFSPMQTMGSVGRRYRLILTLHDLIYYRNRTPPRELPAHIRFGWRIYHLSWLPVRMLLRRADAVVTGSHTTKAELVEARVYDRPITVVRSGVKQREPVQRTKPEAGSLVYMGSFMPYKNVDTLARAMHELPGFTLHLLSRIRPAEARRLSRLAPAGSIRFHDGVTDREYRELLADATALVTASRQEGFGIPLVEAMSVGTPVIVSDIPVFHEIGGEAASYFPPDDARELAARVRELDAPREWERRSRLSMAQARNFTWAESAQTLLELMRRVHEPHPGRRGGS